MMKGNMFRRTVVALDLARVMMNLKSEFTTADHLGKDRIAAKAKTIFKDAFDASLIDHDYSMSQKFVTLFLMSSVPLTPSFDDAFVAKCVDWGLNNLSTFELRNLANFTQALISIDPKRSTELIRKHLFPVLREYVPNPHEANVKLSVATLLNALSKIDWEHSCVGELREAALHFLGACEKSRILSDHCKISDWGVLLVSLHRSRIVTAEDDDAETGGREGVPIELLMLESELFVNMMWKAISKNLQTPEGPGTGQDLPKVSDVTNFLATCGKYGVPFHPSAEEVFQFFLHKLIAFAKVGDLVNFFTGSAKLMSTGTTSATQHARTTLKAIVNAAASCLPLQQAVIHSAESSALLSALSKLRLGAGAVNDGFFAFLCSRYVLNCANADSQSFIPALAGCLNLLENGADDHPSPARAEAAHALVTAVISKLMTEKAPTPGLLIQVVHHASHYSRLRRQSAAPESMSGTPPPLRVLLSRTEFQSGSLFAEATIFQLIELSLAVRHLPIDAEVSQVHTLLDSRISTLCSLEVEGKGIKSSDVVPVLKELTQESQIAELPCYSAELLRALGRQLHRCSPYEIRATVELLFALPKNETFVEIQQASMQLAVEHSGKGFDFKDATSLLKMLPSLQNRSELSQSDLKTLRSNLCCRVASLATSLTAHQCALALETLTKDLRESAEGNDALSKVLARLSTVQAFLSISDCSLCCGAVSKIASKELLEPAVVLQSVRSLAKAVNGFPGNPVLCTRAIQMLSNATHLAPDVSDYCDAILRQLQPFARQCSLLEVSLVLTYSARLKAWNRHTMEALFGVVGEKAPHASLQEVAALLIALCRLGFLHDSLEVGSVSAECWTAVVRRYGGLADSAPADSTTQVLSALSQRLDAHADRAGVWEPPVESALRRLVKFSTSEVSQHFGSLLGSLIQLAKHQARCKQSTRQLIDQCATALLSMTTSTLVSEMDGTNARSIIALLFAFPNTPLSNEQYQALDERIGQLLATPSSPLVDSEVLTLTDALVRLAWLKKRKGIHHPRCAIAERLDEWRKTGQLMDHIRSWPVVSQLQLFTRMIYEGRVKASELSEPIAAMLTDLGRSPDTPHSKAIGALVLLLVELPDLAISPSHIRQLEVWVTVRAAHLTPTEMLASLECALNFRFSRDATALSLRHGLLALGTPQASIASDRTAERLLSRLGTVKARVTELGLEKEFEQFLSRFEERSNKGTPAPIPASRSVRLGKRS